MVELRGVAHFSIPVSDVERSTKFYTEIVGCKYLSALPDKSITFLDAAGVCVLLIKRTAPINKRPLEMSNGVHHAFMIDADAYETTKGALKQKGWTSSSKRTDGVARLTDRAFISATPMGQRWSL